MRARRRSTSANSPVSSTGGVSLENLGGWFAAGVFAVGAGSALVPKDAVRDGRWGVVTARAEAFAERIASVRKER